MQEELNEDIQIEILRRTGDNPRSNLWGFKARVSLDDGRFEEIIKTGFIKGNTLTEEKIRDKIKRKYVERLRDNGDYEKIKTFEKEKKVSKSVEEKTFKETI